jgi:dipeptidyl aminopeptidase/acylaminoacyl peptidase
MGEVYRARDTKLGRDVALKVLPQTFASDADRLARFEREARTLASLNHPNIAQLYGVEESKGVSALVMELVPGHTLEDLIHGEAKHSAAMDAGSVQAIARQIADALEAAHEAGIVHRDLKPANIKVRDDGTVKVLDFGLAKAVEGTEITETASTMTSPAMTGLGVILGTAGYMSPEQARGRSVDKRSDVWAFGVVLYEMLTRRRLFGGDTVSDVIAAVLTREPDLTTLPASTPASVRHLLRRCLERDPRLRLRDMGEARIALTTADAEAIGPLRPTARKGKATRLLWPATVIAAAALAGAVAWMSAPRTEVPLRRFTLSTPNQTRVVAAAISPDGKTVVFASDEKAWIQHLDELTPREVPGSTGVRAVFWSPDSAFIGFQARGQLWRVPAGGGTPIAICAVEVDFSRAGGAAWLANDHIVFATGGSGLYEVPSGGGTPKVVVPTDAATEADFHEPSPLPDGRGVLFVKHPIKGSYTIEAFDGSKRHVVMEGSGSSQPVYASGHLLYFRDTGVWAAPFSLSSLAVSGDPFLVVAGASVQAGAADGTLAAVPASIATDLQLTWLDRKGQVQGTLGRVGIPIREPRLSPDGRHVAGTVFDSGGDIWILDVQKGTERRLTFEPEPDTAPAWSPDGQFIVYQCGTAICSRRADGTGARITLVDGPVQDPIVSPKGGYLLFTRESGPTLWDLWLVELGAAGVSARPAAEPRAFVRGHRIQRSASVSPDERHVAYISNEGGGYDVFVTRFPSGDGKWQVSEGEAGYHPR